MRNVCKVAPALFALATAFAALAVDDSRTFTAGGTIGAGLRVKLSNGTAVVAEAAEEMIGVNLFAVGANESANIRLAIPGAVVTMTALGVTTNGNAVYAGAAGKVQCGAYGPRIGYNLSANAADGAAIKVLYLPDKIAAAGEFIGAADGGSTTISTGVGSVKLSTENAADNTAWIPVKYNGTTYYVPGWTTNEP